jgi:hypothetical protein
MSVVRLFAGAAPPVQFVPVAHVTDPPPPALGGFQSIVAAWEYGAAAQASTAALAIKPASRQPFILLDSGRCGVFIPAEMTGETKTREVSTVIMVEWGLGRGISLEGLGKTTISDFFVNKKIGEVKNSETMKSPIDAPKRISRKID